MTRRQKFSNDGFAIRQIMSDARTGNGERREQIRFAQLAREANKFERQFAATPAPRPCDDCKADPWAVCRHLDGAA